MRATILGLTDRDVTDPAITSRLEPATYPAIDATAYEALDGSAIYAGDAAARITRNIESVYVTEDAIHTERDDERTDEVACEWIADLSEGWIGVDTSDGEWLFRAIGSEKRVLIPRAEIDVDGFAAYLRDYPRADAWNVTQSRSLDPDDDAEESVISYHDAAHLADTAGSKHTSMLGFSYWFNESYTRGVVAESGYVALYSGGDRAEHYAEFINSEILPFASLPEEYQGTFADAREETEGQADA